MRKPVVVGNWKMYKTLPEAVAFALEWKTKLDGFPGIDQGFAPTFPALAAFAEKLKGTGTWIAAQNCHDAEHGAFTGEVSVGMLAAAGCKAVIVGHSERRQIFGETDDGVAKKTAAVLKGGLTPIVCVGETLDERKRGATFDVVERQVKGGFSKIDPAKIAECVIAYEPVWAIGTGETATPAQAQEVHARIRGLVGALSGKAVADAVRIQYGGSVKANNAAELLGQPDVDGALVGGASLEAASFAAICKAAQDRTRR
ncbi:MAG TPA: triose-phosphate isomerase [bacterium]|nr:triose-phosphate isomerase [bacterium]